LKSFKERHHIAFEVVFFFAGFSFDVVLLHRIDSVPLLIHQASYLVLTSLLIAVDHRIFVSGKEPKGTLGKLLSYRTWVIHFFLGTLLNAFLVFYFRAASGIWAFAFLVALATVLVINELPQFRKRGPVVRVALLSFSITSYLAYMLPISIGHLHWLLFVAAVVGGSLATAFLWRLYAQITKDENWTFSRAVLPGLMVQVTLLVLYLAHAVPPVPLSLKYIGIFSDVQKSPNAKELEYECKYVPPATWKFWRSDATEFFYRDSAEGEPKPRAYAFIAVFAPRHFDDTLSFNWEYEDPKKGWVSRGSSTHALGKGQGGREEGFRTYAYTTLAGPGEYRVIIRSSDGREIGRKTFEAVRDERPETAELATILN
jgi:hypothetical protein